MPISGPSLEAGQAQRNAPIVRNSAADHAVTATAVAPMVTPSVQDAGIETQPRMTVYSGPGLHRLGGVRA